MLIGGGVNQLIEPLAGRAELLQLSSSQRPWRHCESPREWWRLQQLENMENLLEACALASHYPCGAPPLVFAGRMRQPERLTRLIGNLGISDRVSLRGYLSNAEVDTLDGDAMGLVLVSLGEGFRLPILEAMMNGVSVVTSRDSAMNEVAGDAAVLADPCGCRLRRDGNQGDRARP